MYTFSPDTVIVQSTGELAIGASGVLSFNGETVPVYDLNESPLPFIEVGPTGAHQAFRAEVPIGDLDFGSVVMTKVADEVFVDAAQAKQTAIDLTDRVVALEEGTAGGFGRVIALPRLPAVGDAQDGDLVLVNPNFNG